MTNEQILDKINSFPRWHYQFDLGPHQTPIFQKDHINRHQQRKNYFFKHLVDLNGGSLEGKRILDLGCNAGFWSLAAIENGCDYILGIDGRQMHVDQANFIFEVNEVEPTRFDFISGNIYDLVNKDLGDFDIVFFFGLMYHINKPIELLELISSVNSDTLVIDTLLSEKEGSLLEIRHESLDEPRNAIDYELVLVPTKNAVLEMTNQFGYQAKTLEPNFSDYEGSHDYQGGYRKAFICSKRSNLDTF